MKQVISGEKIKELRKYEKYLNRMKKGTIRSQAIKALEIYKDVDLQIFWTNVLNSTNGV